MTGANPLAMIMQRIMQRNASQPMSEQPSGMTQPFGMPSPMAMPGMPKASATMPQQENEQQMQNMAPIFGQPNMTAGATQGPMPSPKPVMPGDIGQTEWSTKSGRNMAITGSAIQSFSNAFQAGQQKNWQRSAGQAEQLWQTYYSLQKAMADAQDPKTKQAIQQQLEQMMADPKTQKILKKAHSDPTSAEGVGMQRAMAQSKQEAQDQAKIEQMYAQIQSEFAKAQAEQMRAKQEAATAHLRDVQAALEGQVTPKVAAELQGKKDIADAQIKMQQDHWKTWADVENNRTAEMLQAAKLRASQMNKAKGNSDLIKFFQTQYNGLAKQAAEVNKQIKDVNDNIGKTSFWRRGHLDTLNKSLIPLKQQADQLRQQMQDMNQKISTVTAAGAIQMPEPEPSGAGVSNPPSDTIVVKPEDMQ